VCVWLMPYAVVSYHFVLFMLAVCSLPEYFAISSSLSDSDVKAALSKTREMCIPVSFFVIKLLRRCDTVT